MAQKQGSDEEARIRKALKHKSWNEINTYDSWQIFKIMSEFVEGFEKMGRIGPCVSIFGSARTRPGDRHYKLAEETAYLLSKKGFGIVTGGGPGIMEAANKGSHFAGGKSAGSSSVALSPSSRRCALILSMNRRVSTGLVM